MRCFLAIELPEHIQKALLAVQEKLPKAKMTLVKPHQMHVTMKFFEKLSDEEVQKVHEALQRIKFCPFKARLGSLGYFRTSSNSCVVWVSLDPQEQIVALHELIEKELPGFEKDERFESHITLARVRHVQDLKSFQKELQSLTLEPLECEIPHVSFIQSTLTHEGPLYSRIYP